MKKMTLKECVDGHRDLWARMAKSGSASKVTVMTLEERAFDQFCYPCEYLYRQKLLCSSNCPFDWNTGHCARIALSLNRGEYRVWQDALTINERRAAAAKVRRVPLKPWAERQYQLECREAEITQSKDRS